MIWQTVKQPGFWGSALIIGVLQGLLLAWAWDQRQKNLKCAEKKMRKISRKV